MLVDPYYRRGRQYFAAYRHWCVSDHDGTAVVPKSETNACPEVTDTQHAMSESVGGNPVPMLGRRHWSLPGHTSSDANFGTGARLARVVLVFGSPHQRAGRF